MNSKNSNLENVDYLTNRLGRVFESLDSMSKRDLPVVQTDVAAIRQGRGLAALRRTIERDPVAG